MFSRLDDRIEFMENFEFVSVMSDWIVRYLSPWFPNVGKELLFKMLMCMIDPVSG